MFRTVNEQVRPAGRGASGQARSYPETIFSHAESSATIVCGNEREAGRTQLMPRWPKPPEGSWTEHFDLGTEPLNYEDSISQEFFDLEREAVFKRAWLNV